jgi:hypothetical protein
MTTAMAGVPSATEKARKEVERITAAATTTALFVLFQSFVAVLIVYFPRARCREDFVCFGYIDEFLLGGFISSAPH